MKSDLSQMLLAAVVDTRLSKIVAATVDFLNAVSVTGQNGPDGKGQTGKQVSDLHAFRKRSGYYKRGAVFGLDETIEALALVEENVRLGVIETDRGAVALWLDEHDEIVGVILTTMVAKAT